MRRPPSFATSLLLVGVLAGCGGSAAASPAQPGSATRQTPDASHAAASPNPTPQPVNTPVIVTPVPLPTVEDMGATRITVQGEPDWVIVVDGVPWVTAGAGLVPLDPVTGAPGTVVPVEGITCTGLDAAYGAIWAATCQNHSITRIDPATGTVVARTELPEGGDVQEEGSVAAGEGGVWVITNDARLHRVSPKTNKVTGSWPLPGGAAAVRAGHGSLWVTVSDDDQVLRINPKDPSERTAIDVGDLPRFLAVGDDGVWVMNQAGASVTHLSPEGKVVATIKVADIPIRGGDIAVGGGYTWVRTWDSLLVRVGPTPDDVLRMGPVSGSGGVAADANTVWLSAHDVAAMWRLPLPMP
jgi:virginiamycin B lyase